MTELAEKFKTYFYSDRPHPYRHFEGRVTDLLGTDTVLLDAGCGRTVPVLKQFLNKARRLIGVELVEFTDVPEGIETYNADLANIPLPDASVDLIMSRSVFEHLVDPDAVYREFHRLLKPGGSVVFLTANMWDYGTLIARLVPNRFHARIINQVEGRAEEDTFPTAYRTNTPSDVKRLATSVGLEVVSFEYLNQYPNYLLFNAFLFLLGVAYERLTSRFDSLSFLRGWILVTLSKPGSGYSRRG
jgi:SAM-dependent methyltransferase